MQILYFDWPRYYSSISNSHRVAKFAGFVNLFISFYSQINIFYLFSPFYWTGFVAQRERAQQDLKVPYKVPHLTHPPFTYERQPQHPTLIRIVRGFFNVPQNYQHSRNCETGPPAYRPYPRRLESLTICRYNYKGSTFLLSYLTTLSVGPVGVSNSRPPASQPGAQPNEPPVRGYLWLLNLLLRFSVRLVG